MAQTSSASDSLRPDRPRHGSVGVAGITLAADCAGALYWPEEGLLVVADLHLEKGSSFARRGQLLPPYDTTETLARLARLIAHYARRVVITLGDNFHDGDGPARLSAADPHSMLNTGQEATQSPKGRSNPRRAVLLRIWARFRG